MSLSRNKKLWSVAENLMELMSKKRRPDGREQKPTKLHLDALEERQLLSLTVATTENLLVNTSWQDIRGDIAVDSNQAGDLVVAWTAADRLNNPDYNPDDLASSPYLTDEDGKFVEDMNIYARYLTDEVQIITIPQDCVPDTLVANVGNNATKAYEAGSYKAVTKSDNWYKVEFTNEMGVADFEYYQGPEPKDGFTDSNDNFYEPGDYSYVQLTTGWYEVDKTEILDGTIVEDGLQTSDGTVYPEGAYTRLDSGKYEVVVGKTVVEGSITRSGSFDILYNGNETQRFSIFGSSFSTGGVDSYATSNSISCFYVGLYAENELTWTLFKYDSSLLPGDNAANLQAAIRSIPGGEYKEVTVNAYSETDFDITFNGDNWVGYDLPDVRVSNNYYSDITGLIDLFKSNSFDIADLNGISNFQKLILRDIWGNKSTIAEIQKEINSSGRASVIRKLQMARDELVDTLSSAIVTTVHDVQTVTSYNSKGAKVGIVVDSNPYKTAQNIQKAFDEAAKNSALYAPITRGYEYNEKTHRFEYTSIPTGAYRADQSYGSMQEAIKAIEVVVEPVEGSTNQFMITFTGASGLTNQDPLIVSAATNAIKDPSTGVYVYKDLITVDRVSGEYKGTTPTQTVKEPSAVFRVNAPEVAEFVIDPEGDVVTDREGNPILASAGRTNQAKPSVAVSNDGSFVIAWVSENSDALQQYNQTDIMARRFTVRGYLPGPGEAGYDPDYQSDFYENGAEGGKLGYTPADDSAAVNKKFFKDPYAFETNDDKNDAAVKTVQCVYPVADAFVVNASLNGVQDDPCVSADKDGNFIVTWTYVAQDNSYFGGIYGRQFNNEAQPTTGDIIFDTSQVSSNYYGPSYVAMSEDGFAVITWNYGTNFYQSILAPYGANFIVDKSLVAANAYGASVSFDYNHRYALAYTQEDAAGAGGTTTLPVTDSYVQVYEIVDTGYEAVSSVSSTTNNDNNNNNNDNNNDDNEVTGVGAASGHSYSLQYAATRILGATRVNAVTAGDQGNPSVGLDADGDMFVAYQGQGIDIQSITAGNLGDLASTDYSKLFIQLKYEDFENNNLVYKHKQFYRGNKYSYEDKNADLIDYIKLALGWGYDEFGDFTDNGGTPIYQISNYDCSDPDNYIRYFLTVAQKEGATYEQLTRLQAVLEALVSALRNNGYDIGYTNYGQTIYTGAVATTTETANANGNDDDSETVTVITDPRVVSGVVSGYRNGSSANFYISFPAEYVASGTISFDIGIASANDNVQTAYDTCETVTFDFGQYFTDGFLTLNGYTNLINDLNSALNSLNICGGDAYSFVVRPLGYDEIDFYSGSVSPIGLYNEQFQYAYSYTENNVTYTGYRTVDSFLGIQITAQGSLHDTPLYIRQNVRNINNTSLKLMNQAVENADYYYYTDLYVDRYGSYGNLQKNPHVANTSNGDVVVVWSMQQDVPVTSRGELYPSIGNSLTDKYSHIYLRAFTESTDTAGPIVTNVSLPNGEKVDDNQTITSAVKDLVVSFSEDMLSMNDAENATAAKDKSYIRLHAVDNPANWSLLRDGVIVAGAIESIDYGLNRSEPFARETVDEDGNPIEQINFGDLAYGTNRYEAVIHFADGLELTDGNYTLVCSSMVQDAARNAIYSQGYAMDGSLSGFDGHDYELDFSVIRLNEALGFEYSQDNFRYNDYIPVVYVNDTDRQGEDGDEYAFVHDAIDKDGDDYGEHLKQVTRSSILDESSDYGPNTAQAVASNSNGDYVVVWTEETRTDNADGGYTVTKTVYARTYRTLYVTGIDGIRTQVVKDNEGKIITVYTDTGTFNANGKQVDENGAEMRPNAAGRFTDPRQASVAMDDRGRFVVVWDQYTFGPGEDGSRDVYMAKYAFNGGQMQINGNASSPTRVNIEDNDDQQYAAVAMDSDGDIVVVWESYGQDGSGWGVFGRRFVTNGMSYGYQNTVQTIQIIGEIDVQGDQLRLEVDGVSEPIYVPLVVEMQTNAENIKKALVATKVFGENDLDVKVNLNGEISIEFKGAYTSAYVDMIKATVINPNNVGNLSTVVANVTMRQIGVEGQEFQVNETTQNNQRFASIGMDRDGAFVVSWTSWGQDLDSEIESNIYARKFASNHLVASNVRSYEEMSTITVDVDDAIDNPNSDNAEVQIISNDNISYHQVYAGDGYESVCYITVGGSLGLDGRITEPDWSGTGSLLTTRKHVLTAAHVVCEEGSNEVVDLEDTPMYCMFETIEGTISIKVADIIVHPTYTGDPINDNCVDLAVIVLETAAPSSLTGYELYTGTDEIGRSFTVVGYGQYGDVSDEEADLADRPSGVKHIARNTYEITGATYSPTVNPNQLMFDFDDGTYANDYIGNYYGIRNLGLGSEEGCQAQGDSGGPGLINGKIAGVVSWGVSPVVPGGGIYSQVRVSSYVDWISAAVLSDVNGGEFLVNTDATIYFAVDDEDDDDNNNNNNNNDDDTVLLTDSWQKGSQIWSSVAMDGNGDFAITWTGYNQDGNGDALTGGSNNGLGGIFMRVFGADGAIYRTDSVNVVVQVNEYTAYDQIHSQIAMAQNGQFVVAYESYQDPSNDKNSDMVDNFGIYARRYAITTEDYTVTVTSDNTTTTVTLPVRGVKEVGNEFRVSRPNPFSADADDKDQIGASVAMDSNGDMVFAWTDLSYPNEEGQNVESVVCVRSIVLPDDTTPPYVVRANAVYEKPAKDESSSGQMAQVSLYAQSVSFPSGNGPNSLVYGFNEYMYTAQMYSDIKAEEFEIPENYDDVYGYSAARALENKDVKSVIDINDWTLMKDGVVVTTAYIQDIIYGYNASTKTIEELAAYGIDLGENPYYKPYPKGYETNSDELVIIFSRPLPDGSYVLTLNDKVTDASGRNRLDGDYDGESGGSFTVRFQIGAPTADDSDYVPGEDSHAYTGMYGGEGVPVTAANSKGFVIVTEQQVLYELDGSSSSGTNNNNNNNNNNNTTDDYTGGYYNTVVVDGTTYRIESDIILRRFSSDGSAVGVETVVNRFTEGNQIDPDVAMTESGSSVVVWVGESEDALNGVCARFYPGGQGQKEQVQIAGEHGTRCWAPDVCINESSGLVFITWLQGSKDNPNQSDEVYGRFYDLAGNAKGAAFKLVTEHNGKSIEKFDVASMTVDGAIEYVIVYEAYVEETKSFELFQKTVTAVANQGFYSVIDGTVSQVNQSTYRGQYDPQIATNQANGEYYIVWVSDHVSANGADIYARRYNADGSSKSFMGTTNETIVNSIVKNVQGLPDVSCNSNGVVFAWQSYDAEEFNYDSTSGVKQEAHDYGIAVRVFNANGMPVYIDGYVYEEINGIRQVVPRQYGQQLNLDEGEFIINSTTAGNQVHPSVSICNWDSNAAISEYAIPRFVVAWAGPNPNAGVEIEDEDDSNNSGNNGNNNGNNNNTNATTTTGYIGPNMVFYKYIAAASTSTGSDDVIVSALASRYSTSPENSTGNGFYRPIDSFVETVAAVKSDADKVDPAVLKIGGTNGDDAVVVSTRNGKIVSVTVNGQTTSVSSKIEAIYFDGLAGKDKVVYNGSLKESASVDLKTGKTLIVGEQAFVAENVESVDAKLVGAVAVDASAANDSIDVAVGRVAAVSSTGFKFDATGVAEFVGNGNGKASVSMSGTDGIDSLLATADSVALTGNGYSFQAKSFASAIVDGGLGADVATLTGVKALTGTDSAIIATAASQTIVATGFESVDARGTGAASAKLYGTRKSDSVVSNSETVQVNYGTGASLSLGGFSDVAIDGRGGNDSAVMLSGAGANVFDGALGKATLTNGSYSRALSNFSKVDVFGNKDAEKSTLTATLRDTALDDAFAAYGDTATMDVDGEAVFAIVAANRVNVKREIAKGDDTLFEGDSLEFAFDIDNWDN